MADLIDQAAEVTENFTEAAIKKIREQSKPTRKFSEADEPWECVECGAEIPQARARHGYELCVECQSYIEKHNGRRKRFTLDE